MQTVKYYNPISGECWRVKCIQRDPANYYSLFRRIIGLRDYTTRKYPTANEADARMAALGYTRQRPKNA